MHIKIAQKLCPFSHSPGVLCLIPNSTWQVQVFPTLLRFSNLGLASEKREEIAFSLSGPIAQFTFLLDLEKGAVYVSGQAQMGYFCYRIMQLKEGMEIFLQRSHQESILLHCSFQEKPIVLHAKQKLVLPLSSPLHLSKAPEEKLFLGIHKAQDWDLICRRQNLQEILPIWYRIAQWLPFAETARIEQEDRGTFFLLQKCKEAVSFHREKIEASFLQLFHAAFQGILSPRLEDEKFLGLIPRTSSLQGISPLVLLSQSVSLIRSLFFQEKEEEASLLPSLPISFHSGRFTKILCKQGDLIDLEWSKKTLRQAIWYPCTRREVKLHLQKPIHKYRLRKGLQEKGEIRSSKEPLILEEKRLVYIDRMQK